MKKNNFSWIFFVLRRFNSQDTKGRSFAATLFSILGIAFGVMVLIVVLSVMNGFQMGYIDTILKVSSGHIRLNGTESDLEKCEALNLHKYFFKFREAQTIMQNESATQKGVLIRAIEKEALNKDLEFKDAVKILYGSFDINDSDSIVIGYGIARELSLSVGDFIDIIAVSGTSDSDLFPKNKKLIVKGIFKTGYYEVDSSFSFISLANAEKLFGKPKKIFASVKLDKQNYDAQYISKIKSHQKNVYAMSWREYNHAFFGALRIEKNMMMILVVLIFLVVGVNIYNSMRRSIYERREEISVLSSMGAYSKHLQFLFVANGFTIGLIGAILGLVLGLLLSVQINGVFTLTETLVNKVLMFISILLSGADANNEFAVFSPVYFYMEEIPVRIFYKEVLLVFLFGVFSSSSAALIAAKRILKLKPAEVLRYE